MLLPLSGGNTSKDIKVFVAWLMCSVIFISKNCCKIGHSTLIAHRWYGEEHGFFGFVINREVIDGMPIWRINRIMKAFEPPRCCKYESFIELTTICWRWLQVQAVTAINQLPAATVSSIIIQPANINKKTHQPVFEIPCHPCAMDYFCKKQFSIESYYTHERACKNIQKPHGC